MANTIKLKQGSGSDPSASDLALGEPAIRTDTGEIFLKKDDGSIAKVAGGIDDGDKGDITVSNDGATFTIDNDAVTYAKIQNVSATNRILGRDSSGAGAIEEITPANLRTMLNVADGATNVTNTNQLTNGAGFITATLTNEQVQDIVGGMVSGNTESGITVTYQDGDGTLDFSVASQTDNNFTTTLKNKLDGIASGATNVTNTNQLTNGAGFLTSVSNSNVASNASIALSKLEVITSNRIVGNDSGNAVPKELTAAEVRSIINVENGATADQTASEILTLLKTVDGAGSGLDADTLDGVSSGSFVRSDGDDSQSGVYAFTSTSNDVINFTGNATSDNRGIAFNSRTALTADYNDGYLRLNNASEFGNGVYTPLVMRADGGFNTDGNTVINGSGNYVRALSGASDYSTLLRSDTADTASGDITFSGGAGAVTIAGNSDIRLTNGTWSGNATKIQHHNNTLYIQGGSGSNNSKAIIFRDDGGTDRWIINNSGHLLTNNDSSYDIAATDNRVRKGYFDEIDSSQVLVSNGILETKAAIATSHTLATGFNAMAVSPTINSGVTVTVPSGAVWAIV